MSGNSIGTLFTVTTFGESHGLGIGGVIDGCPPGMLLHETDLQPDLNRRRPGQSTVTSQRREKDVVKILSGVYEGKTTGTPIALWIENHDAHTKDYDELQNLFRPGHADYTYFKKYGLRDHRGGGRASARVTAASVAAGAVAKKYLKLHHGIAFQAALTQIGAVIAEEEHWQTSEDNPFFFLDPTKVSRLEQLITTLRREGDSIGAKIKLKIDGVSAGLGEPIFDKLDALLAYALMGVNAVKSVEIGDGCLCALQKGSQHRDEITPEGFLSNHAGGILGGISTGQPIIVQVVLKPASSIRIPGKTITPQNEPTHVVTKGRHDPCVGIRAVPIVEAMAAIVLMDLVLRQKAISN